MILVLVVNNQKTFIGTVKGGEYLDTKEIFFEPAKRPDLFLEVTKMVNPKELEGIIVYSGPGPFTGLRVAVSIANALSFALDLPIAGIKGISDPSELLKEGLKKLKDDSKTPILPFYDREPNINI
ncbi:TPA: hypothetical protein DDW69_02790 [candidate division CPR2 bacterium]|uniref:Universal protein YeaZ n=1 Tax=candidate division CPR2 bacterium GW2011_GWC1_41_48 TaxID=1618344 RepID=A0A0G0W866_UNCC2|nr:MAG: Universal protein YeaZ [candidate division CPR2 bacterium GW2011_GWC2_39_35]KKR29287.1 MAG: Universal protein YeaZ [candidate division CPR2 bacterium GW2011_GWD2_39_7]KKR29647.1 MAG: Universal protein YeaZ [candidate division CPR2 bacterium GW2011_GWD1_39_7]KKS09179.1 MAG: Universal protein YeaZ [candidate division CPR2 bacterium GW2011_GWC1_41_48]OGB56935.1 MAG: hypothetical protein A2Y27_02335 [candidate division CPR2 bacterium GWD1_39_7]OGB70952.1 MAG: hypothetical protein A2Y26_056